MYNGRDTVIIKKDNTKRFFKPSVEEIKSYCLERRNQVEAERFFDYYECNGWKVGKNTMKDWKACVRTWEKNGYNNNNDKPKAKPNPNDLVEILKRGGLRDDQTLC